MSYNTIQSLVRAIAWNDEVRASHASADDRMGLAIYVQDHLRIGPLMEQRFYWRVIDCEGGLSDYFRGFGNLMQAFNATEFDAVVTGVSNYLAKAATKLPAARASLLKGSHIYPAPADVMIHAIESMTEDAQNVLAKIDNLTPPQRITLLRRLCDQRPARV